MTSDLNIFHGKISDFASFMLFIKLRNLFWNSLRYLIFLEPRINGVSLNMVCQTVSDFIGWAQF